MKYYKNVPRCSKVQGTFAFWMKQTFSYIFVRNNNTYCNYNYHFFSKNNYSLNITRK